MSDKILLTDGSGNVKGSIFYDSAADAVRIASHDSNTPAHIDGYIDVSSSGLGGGSSVSGTWTPTVSPVANVDSASAAAAGQYLRVGSIVTCSIRLTVDPTATGNASVGFTVPFGGNFTDAGQGSGTCAGITGSAVDPGSIQALASNAAVLATFTASATSATTVVCHFSYEVQ